jgi:hypothetical protein|tara:strand:- start:366 stop:548 length:183 start_codon:yes stop_codon:yes gene_type:complete
MQLKFTKRESIRETLVKRLLKILAIVITIIFLIFLLDKINFPSPENKINKNITNEIIKLK